MIHSKTFEIDFTEAKAIPALLEQPESAPPSKTNRLHKIWGFSAEGFGEKASGPAALGTVLHFHEIGWNHLPKHQNGRPLNAEYLTEIIRWSASPDLLSGSLGTSPSLMLHSLRKAGLNASWYAGNPPEKTLELITQELSLQRPVIVLINHRLQGHPLLLEWQVIFKVDEEHIYTKHSAVEDGTHATPADEFVEMILMEHPQLSCSIITACKD